MYHVILDINKNTVYFNAIPKQNYSMIYKKWNFGQFEHFTTRVCAF